MPRQKSHPGQNPTSLSILQTCELDGGKPVSGAEVGGLAPCPGSLLETGPGVATQETRAEQSSACDWPSALSPGAVCLWTCPASSGAFTFPPVRWVTLGHLPHRGSTPHPQGALGYKAISSVPAHSSSYRLGDGAGFHCIYLRAFKLIFNPSFLWGSFSLLRRH